MEIVFSRGTALMFEEVHKYHGNVAEGRKESESFQSSRSIRLSSFEYLLDACTRGGKLRFAEILCASSWNNLDAGKWDRERLKYYDAWIKGGFKIFLKKRAVKYESFEEMLVLTENAATILHHPNLSTKTTDPFLRSPPSSFMSAHSTPSFLIVIETTAINHPRPRNRL